VVIIVLSILSTLTSGPLVIQRQITALRRRLHSSCPEDLTHVYVLGIALFCFCLLVLVYSIVVASGTGTDSDLRGLVTTLICIMSLLPCLVVLPIAISFIVKYCNDVTSHELTKTSNLNDELPYDSTLPRPRWHPKISPYRFISFLTPLVTGTVKAALSLKGSVTTPITLEWISGVVVFLV
jgi:ABC-type proline/glycine betaine transport system permease subunit